MDLPSTDVSFYTILRWGGAWVIPTVVTLAIAGVSLCLIAWGIVENTKMRYAAAHPTGAADTPAPAAPSPLAQPQRPAPPPPIDLGDGDSATRTTDLVTLANVRARRTVVSARVGQTQARLTAFVMMQDATWAYGARRRYVDSHDRAVDIDALFQTPQFLSGVGRADYIVGIGVASGVGQENDRLASNRAVELCATLYQIDSLDRNTTRVYGLPLGHATGAPRERDSDEERLQRTVIVIGVERLSGSPDLAHLLRKVLDRNLIDGIDLRSFSRARSIEGSQLIEVCPARPL